MQRQIFLAGFFVFLICQLLVRLHRLECAFRARCASDRGESLDEETLDIPGWLIGSSPKLLIIELTSDICLS
jgi:hypothetical protein